MKRFLLVALPILILAGCIKKRLLPTAPPVVVSTSDTVMYYWSFNDTSSGAVPPGPDFAVHSGASIAFTASYIDYTGGANVDTLPGVDSGFCLRVRNPSDSIVIYMPTTGYDSVVLRYAEQASSTSSGSTVNSVDYTVDGVHFISTALGATNTYNNISINFQSFTFDFSSDPATANNPKFAVSIVFDNNNSGTSGNDRFDNVTLLGKRQ